jgi:hypothetical protein
MFRSCPLPIFSFLVFVLALPWASFSKDLRVPSDCPTIQSAIDRSQDGDQIRVAPGTYGENINFKGKAILVAGTDGPEATVIEGVNVPWPNNGAWSCSGTGRYAIPSWRASRFRRAGGAGVP